MAAMLITQDCPPLLRQVRPLLGEGVILPSPAQLRRGVLRVGLLHDLQLVHRGPDRRLPNEANAAQARERITRRCDMTPWRRPMVMHCCELAGAAAARAPPAAPPRQLSRGAHAGRGRVGRVKAGEPRRAGVPVCPAQPAPASPPAGAGTAPHARGTGGPGAPAPLLTRRARDALGTATQYTRVKDPPRCWASTAPSRFAVSVFLLTRACGIIPSIVQARSARHRSNSSQKRIACSNATVLLLHTPPAPARPWRSHAAASPRSRPPPPAESQEPGTARAQRPPGGTTGQTTGPKQPNKNTQSWVARRGRRRGGCRCV
eukprot:COSAG01_NODE_3070_length_6638_cov_14.873528_5_plen_317_part_00